MKVLLGLFFCVVSTSSSVYPECPNLKEETVTALKQLKVSEDVHDKLVGEFSEVWGPREVIDPDENTCIKFLRQDSDEKTLSQTMTVDGDWFEGKRSINLTLEKVENGIYFARKDGIMKAVFFILYAKNNVVTHYAWEACSRDLSAQPPAGKNYITYVTGVSVRIQELQDLQDSSFRTRQAVDEAVRVILGHKDLLGNIVPLTQTNC